MLLIRIYGEKIMKKRSIFIYSLVLVVGIFLFATANTTYADPIYVGTVQMFPYVGTEYSNLEVGKNATEEAVEVNSLIDAWNYFNEGSLKHVSDFSENYWNFTDGVSEGKSETITWEGNWNYLTVKYGTQFDLYYIGDSTVNFINWTGKKALSHVRLWDGSAAAPVPEPATMILLGSGLLGLAGFGRKFKK
jgi:hypothetical protein